MNGKSTTAEWVSAIATLAAVFVALAIALAPAIKRLWGKPRLTLRVGDSEPHLRLDGTGLDIVGARLRVEIHNSGRSEASRVRATAVRWWALEVGTGRTWVELDIDPAELHWVGQAYRSSGDPQAPETSIGAGESRFLDLSYYDSHLNRTRLDLHDPQSAAFDLVSPYDGEQRIDFVITAANTAAVRSVVSYTVSTARFITDIHLGDAPPEDQVQRRGILNVLRPVIKRDLREDG